MLPATGQTELNRILSLASSSASDLDAVLTQPLEALHAQRGGHRGNALVPCQVGSRPQRSGLQVSRASERRDARMRW